MPEEYVLNKRMLMEKKKYGIQEAPGLGLTLLAVFLLAAKIVTDLLLQTGATTNEQVFVLLGLLLKFVSQTVVIVTAPGLVLLLNLGMLQTWTALVTVFCLLVGYGYLLFN